MQVYKLFVVAWRLIDVVREGQKLNKMTSMLLSHPDFESFCSEQLGFGHCNNRAQNETEESVYYD